MLSSTSLSGANWPAVQASDMSVSAQDDDLLRNSTLYQDFLAEREEILKHKWIESEKAGHDIGFERALTDWILKYRSGWRKWRRSLRAAQP